MLRILITLLFSLALSGNAHAQFFDNFDRTDSDVIGGGWLEKLPTAFGLQGGEVVLLSSGAGYRSNIVYRPASEDLLDVEASVDFRLLASSPGYPEVYTRIQSSTVTNPSELDAYLLYIDGSTSSAVLSRQLGDAADSRLATFSLAPALNTTDSYRLRLRATGTSPVHLVAFVERKSGAGWEIVGGVMYDDSSVDRITTAGSVGFSGSTLAAYTYDNFTRAVVVDSGSVSPTLAAIDEITPRYAQVGSPAISMIVQGQHFTPTSIVRINGSDRATTYISHTELQVAIGAADIAQRGTAAISVFDTAPSSGQSNTLSFAILGSGELFDDFNRSDNPDLQSSWIEKNPDAFEVDANQAKKVVVSSGYHDNLAYRPTAEDRLDSETSIEFTLNDWSVGYPQLWARVKSQYVTDAGKLFGYILYVDNSQSRAILGQQYGGGFVSPLATINFSELLNTNDLYRLRMGVTGADPVQVGAYVEKLTPTGFQAIGSTAAVDDSTNKITIAGTNGFGGYTGQAFGYDNFRVRDNAVPVANAGADQTVGLGNTVQFDGSASNDPDGDTLNYHWNVVSSPAASNPVLTGSELVTPILDTDIAGDYAIELVVDDGLSESAADQIVVSVTSTNQAPVADTQSLSVPEDASLTLTLTGSDPDADPLTFIISQQPGNGTLTGSGANLTYIPNSNFFGTDSFQFIANDGQSNSVAAAVAITVMPVNDLPVLSAQSLTTTEDSLVSVTLVATDVDNDSLNFRAVAQPANGTVDIVDIALTYTPIGNYNGSDSVQLVANDGVGDSAPVTFDITVTALNDAPVAQSETLALDEDSSRNITLNATDVDGDILSYAIIQPPANGVLSGTAPNLTYTPNRNYNGTDSFTFNSSDGNAASSDAVISLNVTPVNDAPQADAQNLTTQEDVPLTITLSGSDVDGDGLTYSTVAGPSNGTVTGTPPNMVYTPLAGFFGTDTIEFNVSDGTFDSTAQIAIDITSVNEAPVITSSPLLTAGIGQLYSYQITATDNDGDTLSYSLSTAPSGMTIDETTGFVAWVSVAAQSGSQDVVVVVSDDQGVAATQIFTINVELPERPVNHEGTEFWIAPTENFQARYRGDLSLFLVSGEFNAQAQINISRLGRNETVSLPAGQLVTYVIGNDDLWQVLAPTGGLNEDGAIQITSDRRIAVYAMHYKPATTDGFLALPTESLGREYVVASYSSYLSSGPKIAIIATQDNTEVEILPVNDIYTNTANVSRAYQPFTVTLNQGDVYRAFAVNSRKSDSTGSIIRSNNPVAVYGEHTCAQVPVGTSACDHLVEQLPPMDSLGDEYLVAPLSTRIEDTIRVVAPYDNTDVIVDGVLVERLSSQQYYEFVTGAATHIKVSEPVIVSQYSNGDNYDELSRTTPNNYADPFMMVIPPVDQFLNRYQVNTPESDFQYNFINVVAPQSAIASLQLDGQAVNQTEFQSIGETEFVYGQLPVGLGSHRLQSDEAFGIYVYGFDYFNSYGYIGGLAISRIDDLATVSLQGPVQGTVGEEVCSTVSVLDSGANPIWGARVKFSVNGVRDVKDYVFTNRSGNAQFCYQGLTVGAETLSATVLNMSDSVQVEWIADNTSTNQNPAITSTPELHINDGDSFNYRVTAIDPDGDPLTYNLSQAPVGMAIDNSGLISWVAAEISERPVVTVEVDDGAGGRATQRFMLSEVAALNIPPNFPVQPPLTAQQSIRYYYNPEYTYEPSIVTALDADDGFTVISLLQGPSNARLLNRNRFDWTPAEPGLQTIVFEARDVRGGVTLQTLNINVSPDLPATFVSQPGTRASVGNEYLFASIIEDDLPGFEQLHTVGILEGPQGMSGYSTTDPEGRRMLGIRWTPAANQVGTHTVRLVIDASTSAPFVQGTLEFTIEVTDSNAPVITSSPVTTTGSRGVYEYQIIATDADGDPLSYRLEYAPPGMLVNSSGLVNWVPGLATSGNFPVWLLVDDDRGGVARQQYTLSVSLSPNQAPQFISTPQGSGVAGELYTYAANANDANGDPILFDLGNSPEGMTIDTISGMVEWTPTSGQLGNQTVNVVASDGAANTQQVFTIEVTDFTAPLDVSVTSSPTVVNQSESVTVSVITSGGRGGVDTALTVNGTPVTLDAQGQATVVGDRVGRFDLVATASDADDTVTTSGYFTVRDPLDITAPNADITSPADSAVISEPIDITGTASDANLAEYTVSIAPTGQGNHTQIASGTASVNDGVLGQFDPSLLMNGQYDIRLNVTDLNGQTTSDTVVVSVDGDLKVGNFSFTVEDMNIPLSGIPIRVTRTYDDRRKSEDLDFGYGWSINYQDVRIDESRAPGASWELQEIYSGPFNTTVDFCVRPQGAAPIVSVALPTGRVERFEVRAVPECNRFTPILDVNLAFVPADNALSTLDINGGASVRLVNNNLEVLGTAEIYDPDSYILTTREGYQYRLDEDFGIRVVVDPNGNTISYTDNGIVHSDGPSITFNRNAEGRIQSMVDPSGNAFNYTYDASGNLAIATDPAGNATRYTYNRRHGLLDIIDSLGRNIIRNIYDDNGRLIAQEDSDGNRTDYNHDLAGRQSVVTDRLGRITQLFYDEQGQVTSQVDALNGVTSYSYDVDGNQLDQTDANGNTTSATYDTQRNQLTQTDALGNTVTFAYNNRGQETSVGDARGNTFANTYDGVGNLLTVTDPLGNVAGNNINSRGLVTLTQDATGNSTTFTYDGNGNKLSETDAEGNTTTYTYDANGNVLTESRTRTDNGVQVTDTTTFVYDSLNRVISTTDALGNTSTTTYDALGNVVRQTDPLDRVTTMTFDAYQRLTGTTYPDSSSSSSTYDAEGNLLSETDRLGRATSYVYDALDRLTQTTYPDGSTSRTEYDAVSNVTAEVDERGSRTEYEYDVANRRTLMRDALGNETVFTYDADGNLISQTDANGNTVTYTVNALDQRTVTTYADSSTTQETFDVLERLISKSDQAGIVTNYAYDGLGRLTSVTDALNGVTRYTYDEAGNKLTQTDAGGNVTRWRYDALGRIVSRTLPMGQIESMSYDANGNMTSHTDFNGATHNYTYDVNNRLIQTDFADGSQETFTYDAAGNRQTATNAGGTISYVYDDRDRLIQETNPDGSSISYNYDAAGNRTEVITSVNTNTGMQIITNTHTFDLLNRLASTTDNAGNITSYGYDATGNRQTLSYPNGNVTTYNYDNLNRLTNLSTDTDAGITLLSYAYTLHPTGRRTQIVENSGRTTAYTYDDLYRLTNETVTDTLNGNYTSSYQHDATGNRAQSNIDGVTTNYYYDANDRLIAQGGCTYTFDANGNTLVEVCSGTPVTYSYNSQNERVGVTSPTNTTSYSYNPDGIRTGQSDGSGTTNYLVDHNRDYSQVLAEVTDGAIETIYVYGDDLISQSRNGAFSYYQYDGLGSTRALSDNTGTLTDEYNYDAFGVELNVVGGTENGYRFVGEQFDSTLGMTYLRNRYYNSNTGRFQTMDTWPGVMSDPVTLHKYLYGNADPANNIDPTGKFSLISIGVANDIRSTLANLQVEVGFSLLDGVLSDGESSGPDFVGLGVAAIGGAASFKLLRMLSSKFRKTCNSFTGDTLVNTENGLIPISDIKIGDRVFAYNEETGETELQDVIHLVQGEGDYQLIELTTESGETIETTSGHPFYVKTESGWKWLTADAISTGDMVKVEANQSQKITGVKAKQHKGKVYNLTVNNTHTYYVGEDNLLAHNAGRCKPLTGIDMEHILRGTKGRGWHHRPNGVNLSNGYKILKVLDRPKSPKAPYRLLVQAPGGEPKASTFWPNSWSSNKIATVISEVYLSKLKDKGVGNHIVDSKYGFKIEFRIVPDGKGGAFVNSAFPNIK